MYYIIHFITLLKFTYLNNLSVILLCSNCEPLAQMLRTCTTCPPEAQSNERDRYKSIVSF